MFILYLTIMEKGIILIYFLVSITFCSGAPPIWIVFSRERNFKQSLL